MEFFLYLQRICSCNEKPTEKKIRFISTEFGAVVLTLTDRIQFQAFFLKIYLKGCFNMDFMEI